MTKNPLSARNRSIAKNYIPLTRSSHIRKLHRPRPTNRPTLPNLLNELAFFTLPCSWWLPSELFFSPLHSMILLYFAQESTIPSGGTEHISPINIDLPDKDSCYGSWNNVYFRLPMYGDRVSGFIEYLSIKEQILLSETWSAFANLCLYCRYISRKEYNNRLLYKLSRRFFFWTSKKHYPPLHAAAF